MSERVRLGVRERLALTRKRGMFDSVGLGVRKMVLTQGNGVCESVRLDVRGSLVLKRVVCVRVYVRE